jgi:hypothetical protein
MEKDFYWEIKEITTQKQLKEFIKKNKTHMNSYDWLLVTKLEAMSPEIAQDYNEEIDWQYYCTFGDLKESLIEANIGFIDWYSVSKFQNISLNFIKKYEDKLSFDKLIKNEYIRSKGMYSEVYRMYTERSKNPKYLAVWEENTKKSMFYCPIKKIATPVLDVGIVEEKEIELSEDEILKMSKNQMKEFLNEKGIRVYYHDTIGILRNKIKESQGDKDDSSKRSEDKIRTPRSDSERKTTGHKIRK